MISQTSKTASPFFNNTIGRTDNTRPPRVTDDDIKRGDRRRAIDMIEEIRWIGKQNLEVWE